MPWKGLSVATMDVYVVRIPIKIVIEAVRLENIDKMAKIHWEIPYISPYEGIWLNCQKKQSKLSKLW